jgi:hypothetical protein
MKDSSFSRNSKLFNDVESVKRTIRNEIHDKCRNISQSPSVSSSERPDPRITRVGKPTR